MIFIHLLRCEKKLSINIDSEFKLSYNLLVR
nr:MAG TPA: hypothetical protein [Caudoviricetes sp.]